MPIKKILVVDDDPVIREILNTMLVSEGYEVILVEDGLKALAALNSPTPVVPDLILLDKQMPGMNGIEVLSKIKSRSYEKSVYRW